MPRKNTGSVRPDTQRPDKWRAVVTIDGKSTVRRFDTEAEGWAWINEQKYLYDKNLYIPPSDLTLGVWLVEWLRVYVAPNIRIRTKERYMVTIEHLQPLYKYKLQELDLHTISKFFAICTLTESSKNKAFKLLKAALKQAAISKMLYSNPLEGAKPPKPPENELPIMNVEDINIILGYCKAHNRYKRYYPIFFMLANTGARIGEMLALEWQSVNLAEQEITIKQSVEYSTTYGTRIVEPKTKAGTRTIPISTAAVNLLKSINKGTKFVFPHYRGDGPHGVNNISRIWRKLFELYNGQKDADGNLLLSPAEQIPYRNIHSLRHTHATALIGAGNVSLIDLSKYLGHAKVSHTLDLYGHAMKKNTKAIAESVNNIYSDMDSNKK